MDLRPHKLGASQIHAESHGQEGEKQILPNGDALGEDDEEENLVDPGSAGRMEALELHPAVGEEAAELGHIEGMEETMDLATAVFTLRKIFSELVEFGILLA
jgi:hypothetical protein